MPSLTPKQHRAMEAAAHGHSTIGIPKSVGKEFVAADKHKSGKQPQGSKEHNPGYHGNLDAGKDMGTHVVTKHSTVQHAVPAETACNHGGFESLMTGPRPTAAMEDD